MGTSLPDPGGGLLLQTGTSDSLSSIVQAGPVHLVGGAQGDEIRGTLCSLLTMATGGGSGQGCLEILPPPDYYAGGGTGT